MCVHVDSVYLKPTRNNMANKGRITSKTVPIGRRICTNSEVINIMEKKPVK